MSGWAVGDLAVCVDNTNAPMLEKGRTYNVVGVDTVPGMSDLGSVTHCGLHLAELVAPSLTGACDARRFRKIRPDEHESCEPEFATLVKRRKAPSPQEREKRILEALFPPEGRVSAEQATRTNK